MAKARSGKTLAHLDLAARIRLRRVQAKVSLDQAAAALGVSTMTVRRIEAATTAPDARQFTILMELYGASVETIERTLSDLKQASQVGWWHQYRGVLRPWELEVIGVESQASLIRVWHPALVPELLRTPNYEAAVLAGVERATPAHAERRLKLLTERQQRLAARGCVLWTIIPQSVLYTVVGGRKVMAEQHAALTAAAANPRTTVQVVPLAAPPHALVGAPQVTLLRVLPRNIPDRVVLHGPASDDRATVHDDAATVSRYLALLDRACATAPDRRTPLPPLGP